MAARRLLRSTRDPTPADDSVHGPLRAGRRTKDLVTELLPGEIAVIDHADLDRVAAEGLVRASPIAVINVAASCTGRYPNEGPLILLEAGIVLLDSVGPAVMDLAPGTEITIEGDRVLRDGDEIARGVRQDRDSILRLHTAARARMGTEIRRFVDNTVQYLDENRDLVADDLALPPVRTRIARRHALIVVRGHDYREDLALLQASGYIREVRPVLIGVDGGADALLEAGLRPEIIIGDMDSVSERALRCGAELIVHAYRDGRAPGGDRLNKLGLDWEPFVASGTSEDIAMLLAYELGATLIVAVGTHTSMVDFLDKGRRGMASTVLTRMKVGPILVDAKGVSRLFQTSIRARDLLLMVAAAVIALIVIILVSEPIRLIIRSYWTDFTA
jgi:uncharacterized membrane-anchored protein